MGRKAPQPSPSERWSGTVRKGSNPSAPRSATKPPPPPAPPKKTK